MKNCSKIIAVDFDGVLCENRWPQIGRANTELIFQLIERKNQGDKLILWTCRAGRELTDAVQWCGKHGLYFDAVNENLPEIIAGFGSDTRKIFAHEYIDDRNACDLPTLPFVANERVREMRIILGTFHVAPETLAKAADVRWTRLEAYLQGEMTPTDATLDKLERALAAIIINA